jgi:hypothetical protein
MRTLLIFGLIIGILFPACKQVDKLTMFDIDFTSSVTIPSSSGINLPLDILTPDIETNSESTFAVNNTQKELIEEITLKTMDLEIQSPGGADFKFLKSIEIYLNATDLPEIRIAWDENVSDGIGPNLELETTAKDLKEYIKKDKFNLRVYTVTDETINQDHEILVNSVFHVDAKILGQ